MSSDPRTIVAEARRRYFEANGLGEGGYADRWVVLRLAGVPVAAFPNTRQRVRSVRFHDLHHVATGYGTSLRGEAEIGAWELASGCHDHAAAWLLNGAAVLLAGWLAPRRVARAFRAGRRCRSLYAEEWDERVLDLSVAALRARLHIPEAGLA